MTIGGRYGGGSRSVTRAWAIREMQIAVSRCWRSNRSTPCPVHDVSLTMRVRATDRQIQSRLVPVALIREQREPMKPISTETRELLERLSQRRSVVGRLFCDPSDETKLLALIAAAGEPASVF